MSVNDASARPVIPSAIAEAIVTPQAYVDRTDLDQKLAWLRANEPLGLVEADGYDPFWMVTKHADIQEIGRQPAIFNNSPLRFALISRQAAEDRRRAHVEQGAPLAIRTITGMDPPEHGPFRRLTFGELAPRGIKGLQDDIRALARRSIADLARMGWTCDFLQDIALYYPMRVILALLGVPEEHEAMLLKLTQGFFNPSDPDLNVSGQPVAVNRAEPTGRGAVLEARAFFQALLDDRRRNPTGDLASVIANGVVGDKPIDDWDAICYYITVFTAGHDTTSSSMAGGIWALAQTPEEFAKVKADRSLIPGLVEESIRWTTPINHFMRTATQPYRLRDRRIEPGDWLMLSYGSANRDEEMFAEPDRFKVDRAKNPQIGFGYGAHVCLGQHLARMEMQIFLEELFDRVDAVTLTGRPVRSASVFVGSVKSVPVQFTPSAQRAK